MLSSDSISVDIGSPKKWRINGIIEIMNFHKFRVDVISIMNFFKNGGKAGEFLRKADNYFTTTRVTGKVTIELPNGVTGIIVDLENDNRYIHFAEPIYFSFEYESKLAGSKFKITCDLKETDTGKSLCDGTHEYSSQSPLTGMMKSPSNSVSSVRSNALRRHLASFKAQLKQLKQELNQEDLISSTVDIIAKVMNLYGYEKLYQSVGASDIKECLEQLMAFPALIEGASLTEKIALAMELLHNVTGAFLINLNTEKIKESGQQPHRIEGDWQVTKADPASNKHVEGFGQLYLLPEASIFSLGDFAESLGLTLPDIVSDIEIPFVGGPSFPLYEVFRNEESKIDYEFDYRLHNRFSANIQSDTPKKYVVFANLWDTDGDGALDFDDCLAKGNALGLEMVDLSQSLSYRFSQCDNDEVVHSMFNSVGDPIVDSEANLVWYKINGSLEISGGNDDAGGSFEPYGKLHINVGQRTVNQDFVIWDVPSDRYSWCKDFPRTYTQPFTIYFREKNDFFESTTEKITFIGKIMEDDTSPNDDDLIADYDGYQINVNSITFGDQAHFKFNGNGEEYWANIVIEASTMEFSEPPEELVDYQLTGSLKIWCDDDAGLESHYEAYGDLTVDIGNLAANQNIQLWHVSRDNYIEERLGTPITREFQHSFKETSSFTEESQTTNKLVTHGRVRESDTGSGGHDDTIGDYEGYSAVPHLLLESKTKRFQQDSDDYVDLTFKITPIVSTRRIHEYILNGSIYIFQANDTGSNYETYGYLNVDIGSKVGNQRRQMWYVSQSDHLSVPNKHGYTVQLKDQYFTEAVDFMESDQTDVKVYLHGYVKEDDAGDLNDDIGRFEGTSYNPHELENGKKQRFHGQEDGSYVDVYLKMYDLSKHKSTAVIKKKVKVVRKNVEL